MRATGGTPIPHRARATLLVTICLTAAAQDTTPEWQIAAGGKKAFEVASVKLDPGPFRPPNFPLDAGNAFRSVGGRFTADFALLTYITFAYKITLAPEQRQSLVAHLPAWVASDRYDIQASAEGNPTKDQMRLMMQSLLAERFHLAVHFETQVVPVFGMTLIKPGQTGPKLRPHSEGVPCEATPPPDVFPSSCDVYMMTIMPNKLPRAGSRNTTLALLAGALPGIGQLPRPVVDQTGLSGNYDFTLEWAPDPDRPAGPASDARPDLAGPTFNAALREQLGVKLESTKAPLSILVVDHVERPSAN